ncbi:rho-related protein racA-like [Ylistrum balloti]|uniref:rho-related protein racA-like n=1 Tax=Ylistrum balloti TaxID=509963 RepID=UPI002905F7AF|nr:rho-related protein racA-like [Ylistrum balloti]XP_060077824.1 rho-related protein racA-like [Ylistrum balloti]
MLAEPMRKIKLITVGDHAVGKTCLLLSYTTQRYPQGYIPTLFDTYVTAVEVGETWIDVELNDTLGNCDEDYERLRPLLYINGDVFLVCFSVENRETLENVTIKWIPGIRRYRPHAPIVLVGCQIDLRYKSVSDLVSYDEASKFATDLGLCYVETSALTKQGLSDVFDTAARVVVSSLPTKTKRSHRGLFCCVKRESLEPPVRPSVIKAPLIEVEPSRFAQDWMAMHENPVHADVTFVIRGQHNLDAHKTVLCSSSTYFRRVFGTVNAKKMKTTVGNSVQTEGILAVYDQDRSKEDILSQGRCHTMVEISSDIKHHTFAKILQFLYSGVPELTNDQNMIDQNDLADIIRVSKIFELHRLTEICQNCLGEQGIFNPSISTFLTEERGQIMKELYFNKPETADVTFNVEGIKVYAHKSVLTARCEIMAAMFRGHFAEGQTTISMVDIPATSVECFLALLEYLYTDQAPIEDIEVMELIVLADKYGLKRLTNLCEMYITKEIDKCVANNVGTAEIDVIGILQTSQNINAEQLCSWCLHFISTNYTAFKQRAEFLSLKEENKNYIEENQWPPLSYLREKAEYDKQLRRNNSPFKCAII